MGITDCTVSLSLSHSNIIPTPTLQKSTHCHVTFCTIYLLFVVLLTSLAFISVLILFLHSIISLSYDFTISVPTLLSRCSYFLIIFSLLLSPLSYYSCYQYFFYFFFNYLYPWRRSVVGGQQQQRFICVCVFPNQMLLTHLII